MMSLQLNAFFRQNANNEDFWEKVARGLDPSSRPKEPVDLNSILPHLRSKLLAFKAQVRSFVLAGRTSTQPLNLLTTD